MRRTIAVVIDANAKTCGGRCPYRSWADNHRAICQAFGWGIFESERCPPCITAELAYKEATK